MRSSIRQRSPDSWEITIDFGPGPDGRRQRRYATVRGTWAEAQRRRRELLAALSPALPDEGEAPDTGKVSLGGWLDQWMDERVTPHLRQATRQRYRSIIDQHLKPRLGHIELAGLTPSHVQDLEAQLVGEGMSPNGVRLLHSVLSSAMRDALRLELVERNPVAPVSPPPRQKGEANPPTATAVREMLALARAEGEDFFPCIHLIAHTGLRRGEALGLHWQDVDLDTGWLLVGASLVRDGGQASCCGLPGPGGADGGWPWTGQR